MAEIKAMKPQSGCLQSHIGVPGESAYQIAVDHGYVGITKLYNIAVAIQAKDNGKGYPKAETIKKHSTNDTNASAPPKTNRQATTSIKSVDKSPHLMLEGTWRNLYSEDEAKCPRLNVSTCSLSYQNTSFQPPSFSNIPNKKQTLIIIYPQNADCQLRPTKQSACKVTRIIYKKRCDY